MGVDGAASGVEGSGVEGEREDVRLFEVLEEMVEVG